MIKTQTTFARSRIWCAAVLCAAGVGLAACGGGSSSSDGGSGGVGGGDTVPEAPAPLASEFVGVAAAGLPLVGTVTVKDANGVTRTERIGSNGSYSINVEGMTGPYIFRAMGLAGGRSYVIHSTATQADVGGVINVTPLTDLVLSNLAGEIAQRYFDRCNALVTCDRSDALTASALQAEVVQLRERLLPVLQALGVEAGIDLLRTPFTPLASALDTALDVLRVDYDEAGAVATITNIVTQQFISDDLTVTATAVAPESGALDAGAVASSGDDIGAIRTLLTQLSDQFGGGSATAVQGLLSSNFLFSDEDEDSFSNIIAGADAGIRLTDVVIDRIDYSVTPPIAVGSWVSRSEGGNFLRRLDGAQFVKEADVWKFHGDQRVLDIEASALMVRTSFGSNGNVCTATGLILMVDDVDPSNNSGLEHIIVTGPGLPTDGVRLNPSELGGSWGIADSITSDQTEGSDFYALEDSCSESAGGSTLTAIPRNAAYTFTGYQSGGEPAGISYTWRVAERPLSLAELSGVTQGFPSVTPDYAAFSNYSGGALQVAASGLDVSGSASIELVAEGMDGAESQEVDLENLIPTQQGTLSQILTVNAGSFSSGSLKVESLQPNGRSFMVQYWRY
ncbi:MAG: hypothetical protein U1D25_06690 [Hydrogenophaga sp.]|uniref:hypothetical protein n=1 Tax=Hydrogenophaga sp. TaxID=1904254 RepID=UPI0027613594|nr:hypothetical protein [Hydrogenophaga sp.]MDP2417480.1 hypothetical protein [Hydrogenophaga sp.]MDZ4187777.1 hypothetical protein [Hydrogenophaga sp.]